MTTIVYRDGILAVDDLVTLKNNTLGKGVKCGQSLHAVEDKVTEAPPASPVK